MHRSALLQPFDLHGLTLPNRVVMAPLTRARAGSGRVPNALMAEYYVQRASAGLIISEATTISPQANGWLDSPGIYTDAMVAGWQAVTAEWPSGRVGVRLAPNGVFNDMGSPNFREQFLHVGGMLNRYPLAYLHVVDGLAFGFHKLGEPLTLGDFRDVFQGPLMGNCGYTQETAERAVADGAADLITFGRPYITNPDLVERFAQGWPLADSSDMSTWYSPAGREGYTDFPAYQTT